MLSDRPAARLTRRALLAAGGAGAVTVLAGAKPYRAARTPGAPVITGVSAGDGRVVVSFQERPRKEKVIEYEVVEVAA